MSDAAPTRPAGQVPDGEFVAGADESIGASPEPQPVGEPAASADVPSQQTPGESAATAAPAATGQRPPLARSRTDRWLAGVAGGLAEHLNLPSWAVRLAFVLMAPFYYLGIALYGLLWVLLPEGTTRTEAPGLQAARHLGMRAKRKWQMDAAPLVGLALLAAGIVWLTNSLGLGLSNAMLWPALFAVAGVALVWRQADAVDDETDRDTAAWLRPFLRSGGWLGATRLVVGLGLVGLAVSMVTASRIGVQELPTVLAMSLLLILGVMIAAAPWIYRARRSLNRAREEKLVADARADMAAHLHDSVLQSLALIQRQAGDPKAVTSIARRQERELRQWLYGDQVSAHESVKAALTSDALDIEADRGVPIEVVVVGDAPLTENTEALVAAAREAMVNAAKHSGAESIDVFAEEEDGVVEVFVRDRGAGFDLDAVDADRLGVRRSIIDRMERHGGSARIRSAPGEGTDIRLRIPIG